MVSYLFIIFTSMFSTFFDVFSEFKKSRKTVFYFLILLISIFIGFRSNLPDYTNYVNFYLKLPTNFMQAIKISNFDFLFIIFSVFLKLLYNNIYFYFFIIAFITIYLTFNAYKKLSNYYLISIYLYISSILLFLPMVQIRNALALGIIMNSIKYISTKEKGKYFSLIILASFFHWSSIVFIPVYYLNKIKFKTKMNILLLILFPIIISLIGSNITHILEYLVNIIPFEKTKYKILFYLNSLRYSAVKSGFSPRLLSSSIILFIAVFFRNTLKKKQKMYDVFLGLYYIYFSFRFLVLYMGIFVRMFRLFEFSEPIILTSFIYLFKHKNLKIIYILLLLTYGFLQYLDLITGPVFRNYINVLL